MTPLAPPESVHLGASRELCLRPGAGMADAAAATRLCALREAVAAGAPRRTVLRVPSSGARDRSRRRLVPHTSARIAPDTPRLCRRRPRRGAVEGSDQNGGQVARNSGARGLPGVIWVVRQW